MLLIISLISFAMVFLIVNALFSGANSKKANIDRRMAEIANANKVVKDEENKSFKDKMTDSISEVIEKLFFKNSKQSRNERLQKKLDNAGLSKITTPIKYTSGLIISSIVLFFVALLLVFLLTTSIGKALIFALVSVMFYLYAKNFMLLRKVAWRRNRMVKDLPYTLDLILVSIEAGLSFDGAISKVVTNIPGPLSEEFAKTLKEMRMGIERKIAMRNMSTRCSIRELSTLITSIIQADELGVALGKIIRIEASTLREDRKQKAREKAMKAPVKILIPLILFVFPTIFIVVLGPAILQIMEFFK